MVNFQRPVRKAVSCITSKKPIQRPEAHRCVIEGTASDSRLLRATTTLRRPRPYPEGAKRQGPGLSCCERGALQVRTAHPDWRRYDQVASTNNRTGPPACVHVSHSIGAADSAFLSTKPHPGATLSLRDLNGSNLHEDLPLLHPPGQAREGGVERDEQQDAHGSCQSFDLEILQ